jgi:hypothetical protein
LSLSEYLFLPHRLELVVLPALEVLHLERSRLMLPAMEVPNLVLEHPRDCWLPVPELRA